MGTSIKERIKRLIPSRSRQASRERHDAADSRTSHEATATASTDVAPQSSSPDHLKRYFPSGNTLGLSVLHSPEDAQVDIIFIHGLMGDAYRTWADERANVYWPVDLLGKENNDARIIAFGYDSQVLGIFSPVGQNTLRGHADSILGQIANLRPASSKESRRKIILVVHSLGGLVAKKALCVSAQSPHKHLRQLHQTVHGILFLGTPHRGSNLAPNAQRLARFFKLFGSASVNPRILEPLLRDSPILEEVENDFGNWLKGEKKLEHITCFYEELEVPSVGFIVSKESATISGTPGPYSIHANHMQMARFRSPHDPGFRLVHGELKRWIDAIEEETQPIRGAEAFEKKDMYPMLQSLAFPEMDSRRQLVKDTTPGTCSWAFDSSTYKQFLVNGGLLWIKGKPGSGKSTLLRRILTTVRDDSNTTGDIIASFFFWGSGSELQKSKLGLYRTLLHQLCQVMPQLCSEMTGQYRDKELKRGHVGDKWDWDERQLSDTLMDHLGRRPLSKRTWIFLDALDEAGEKNAKTIVEFLKDLLSAARGVNTSSSQSLGICFTCRHYPIIRAGTNLQICLEDQNGPDISIHSRAMLVKWSLKSTEVEYLCNFITGKAKGVFLWAQLVLDQINRHHQTRTFRQIQKIIDETPHELKQFYIEKLQSIDDQDMAQSLVIFQWICFAREPLSLNHLRIALLFDINRPEQTLEQCMKADDYIAEDGLLLNVVLDRTRGLAQISPDQRKTIQLIHQSVKDFLENHFGELRVAPGPSHHQLFRSCLKSMSFPEFIYHWNMPPSRSNVSLSTSECTSCRLAPSLPERASSFVLTLRTSISDESLSISGNRSFLSDAYTHSRGGEESPSDLNDDVIARVRIQKAYDIFVGYATRHWYHHALAAERGPRFEESIVHILDTLFDDSIGQIWLDRFNKHNGIWSYSAQNDPCMGAISVRNISMWGVTLLHVVAACGLLDILKLAIGNQRSPTETKKVEAPTLLHWAAACGQKEVSEWLLSTETVYPNKQTSEGDTALHWSIKSAGGEPAPSERILATLQFFAEDSTVDWQLKNKRGSTALHEAAYGGLSDVLQTVLRKRNVKLSLYDNKDWTPLDKAIQKRRKKTLDIMITTMVERFQNMARGSFIERHGKVDSACLGKYLSDAGRPWGHADWVIGDGDSAYAPHGHMMTVLHFTAQEGRIDLCQILIDSGFKVDVKDQLRREPLHRAAESGHLSIVKLLIFSGANIHSQDVYGLSPTHLAIIQGHFDVAQTLAQELAKSDDRYMTKFFRAILHRNESLAYRVCLEDADYYQKSSASFKPTLLQNAIRCGDFKMVQAVATPSNVETAFDENGRTPLHAAAEIGHQAIVTLLIHRGADAVINQKDRKLGWTPLHCAVHGSHGDVVRELVKHGADVNVKDNRGKNPQKVAFGLNTYLVPAWLGLEEESQA